MLVAPPLRATLTTVDPEAVPGADVIVNVALLVSVSVTSTEVGVKVMPVAVGVSVTVPPAAARSSENDTDPLAAPPSTTVVAADRLTVEGPSTTVSRFVVTVIALHRTQKARHQHTTLCTTPRWHGIATTTISAGYNRSHRQFTHYDRNLKVGCGVLRRSDVRRSATQRHADRRHPPGRP